MTSGNISVTLTSETLTQLAFTTRKYILSHDRSLEGQSRGRLDGCPIQWLSKFIKDPVSLQLSLQPSSKLLSSYSSWLQMATAEITSRMTGPEDTETFSFPTCRTSYLSKKSLAAFFSCLHVQRWVTCPLLTHILACLCGLQWMLGNQPSHLSRKSSSLQHYGTQH